MLCTHRLFTYITVFGHSRTIAITCNKPEEDHQCWHCDDEAHQVLGHKFTQESYRNGQLTEDEKEILRAFSQRHDVDESLEQFLDML